MRKGGGRTALLIMVGGGGGFKRLLEARRAKEKYFLARKLFWAGFIMAPYARIN